MNTSTPDDEKTLDAFYREVTPKLETMVTAILRAGKPLHMLAALFSRGFDGTLTGGCGSRSEVQRRVLDDVRFAEPARTHVLETLRLAPLDVLPVILVVDRGEGLIVVRVRTERGGLVPSDS